MFKFNLNFFNKNKDTPSEQKTLFKELKKSSIVVFVVIGSFFFLKNQLKPNSEDPNVEFMKIGSTTKEPNLDESQLLYLEKNAPKYILRKDTFLNSNFTPLFRRLTINQINLMRKLVIYNTLNFIENDIQSKYFIFNYKRLNIENVSKFKSGEYPEGVIIQIPKKYQDYDSKYVYQKQLARFIITATINNADELSAVNLTNNVSNNDDSYLICYKLEIKENEYNFSNCKTDYSEAIKYFTDNWNNVNKFPAVVNKNTRIFYAFNTLSFWGLKNNSFCYKNLDSNIAEIFNFYPECYKEILLADQNIRNQNPSETKEYLVYSSFVSKSLLLNVDDFKYEDGFENIGLKQQAIQLLFDKYRDLKTSRADFAFVANKIVNKYWDPEHPYATLDLGTYTPQDIWDLKNADLVVKKIVENNIALEKKQNELKRKKELEENKPIPPNNNQ